MDLPTYTNIWRIEKRLYKLYDLRLPMPLPLVQIGVFAGVFVPWIVLLKFVGIPFESPWHVLYIVPPGVLTWLATRPVIEGKRLTELLLSQGRYLSEPRTWCRLTPIREPREVVIVARVWRRPEAPAPVAAAERAAIKSRRKARKARKARPVVQEAALPAAAALLPRPAAPGLTVPSAALPMAAAAPPVATAPPHPVTIPGAAAPPAPQPLAEYAAQREEHLADYAGPLRATVQAQASPQPAGTQPDGTPGAAGTLGTEDDVRVAGPESGAPAPRPAAKPWRRSARDISHEDDVQAEPTPDAAQAPADLERPPATPQLETPPARAPEPAAPPHGSGKRALASGIRRPGAAPEFWQAADPSTEAARSDGTAAPAYPDSATGPGAALGTPPPATRPDIPQQPARARAAAGPTREDVPQQPVAAKGAPVPPEPSEPSERPVSAEASERTAARETASPAAEADVPARPGADPRPEGERVASKPEERSRPPVVQRPPAPLRRAAAPPARTEAERPAAARSEAGLPEGVREPVREPQRPAPGVPGPPPPTRPEIPMVPGAFGTPAPPATGHDEAGGEPRPAETPVRKDPPKPWSKGLSKPPPRAASTDAMAWPPVPAPGGEPAAASRQEPGAMPPGRFPAPGTPQHEVPQQGTHQQGIPPQGIPIKPPPPGPVPDHPRVQDEQPPPREVRSGPASPVRPRPLPPPPAPPPSGPAITPPDPEHEVTGGGLRRLIQAVGGGHGEADAEYQLRLQQPFHGTRHIVVLGCTGGAGQTVTGLMLGHTFAQHNGEPVVAIDVNPGPGALARRTRSETNETLTGLITRADQVGSLTAMRRYTSQAKSGLDVIAAGKNPLQALDDRDYALAIRTIDRFYSVTLLDAAAAVVARVLPYADQVVLVAPASSDAPRAVAMTFEWLDGHGYEDLRSRAVTVINGVSRRSMDDVEQAEAVARGRCRALVRIPWDDHLSMDRAPRNELRSLRAPTRRAYLALAGVVAGGFTVVPERYQELQQEQEATR